MMPYIRVVNDGYTGSKGQVFYIDEEGKETDISGVVTKVEFSMDVNKLNTATITVVKVRFVGNAELYDFVTEEIK